MTLTIAQQEAIYDAQRSGAIYVKPADEQITPDEQACLDILLKRTPAETLQITRYTRHLDGSIPSDPWTQYDLGEASISIQDAGGGNICLDREMLEFEDNAQMLDLALLLADERVLEALDPSTAEPTYEERFAAGFQDGQAIARTLEECPDRCCPNGTPERDCPACMAKYEAERRQVHARAAAAPTATERADILLSNHEMPDGNQIFDLLLEDHVVSYAWHRCIDWVLWRQAHGKPVQRCGTDDTCPAALDARFSQARDFAADSRNWHPNTTDKEMAVICKGQTIQDWERTPEEKAEIQHSNELLIEIFEALEAHFERKDTHTAPLAE
jgi:hypothetical protein